MIKPVVDVKATLGEKFIVVDILKWTDFKNPSVILGAKLICGAVERFDRFAVKIAENIDELQCKIGDEIEFDNIVSTLYVNNGFVNVSFKADSVKVLRKGFVGIDFD